MSIGIPHSSDVIPTGTGLVQSVECRGITYDSENKITTDLFERPVVAQITTFANGVRRVCCPKAYHNRFSKDDGEMRCNSVNGRPCIYAWKDKRESK